ncbi:hypothetical protein AAFC00_002806 [Neodothiora populina]|uniref:Inositolphosphotransferase Aur1/Ipt1 domain-containing protein n=1 Tax=Neodothiora populina TaxID=2781224 RepID=A0ABR3P8G9_9PEZI
MGAGAFIEPGVVVFLLFGGTWINRTRSSDRSHRQPYHSGKRDDTPGGLESGEHSPTRETDSLLSQSHGSEQGDGWQRREFRLAGWTKEVRTPDTSVFEDRLLSRLLVKLPFLVEVWYWALVYWVYQLGRAFTAVTLVQGTVYTARRHALQVIHLEQALGIFHERAFQEFFRSYPTLMHWINRIYSFIHIPGTILFLVGLYYYTIVSNRVSTLPRSRSGSPARPAGSPAGPALYEARRRTMAVCNLIAFVIFTLWPCMPPRLLSDPGYKGPDAKEAKGYGFVDTVHGSSGESSVWTQNKFCNQYAAMPSLHFGYSLLVGLTIMTIPLAPRRSTSVVFGTGKFSLRIPAWRRLIAVFVGFLYPAIILVAIVATANHFILDAVAGAVVCGLAWNANAVLLNLLPLEDWFLYALRLHKPRVQAQAEAFPDEKIVRQSVVLDS